MKRVKLIIVFCLIFSNILYPGIFDSLLRPPLESLVEFLEVLNKSGYPPFIPDEIDPKIHTTGLFDSPDIQPVLYYVKTKDYIKTETYKTIMQLEADGWSEYRTDIILNNSSG